MNEDNTPVLSGDDPLGDLSALVKKTEYMLKLAQAGEWEKVTDLESERRPRLEALFNSLDQSTREQSATQLQQGVERILGLDREIIALGQEVKAEAANSFRQSRSARRATAVYQKNDTL